MQEIIRLGTYQLTVRRALEMHQAGIGSLGYAAERTGLSKRDLIREARARGIIPPFAEQTMHEELGGWRYLPRLSPFRAGVVGAGAQRAAAA